jgi:large subunit ribosomal protein L23
MNSFIDLIKYPILTEKAVRLFKQNQYSFAVSKEANKTVIKTAIEKLFDVKVIAVNTSTQQRKKRRVGKFIGEKTQNKRAIVTLRPGDSIQILETN